jgi:hypothetical protein
MIPPSEISRRLAARECLRCGLEGMKGDPNTGFPEHYCAHCRKQIDDEARAERKAKRAAYD